MTFYAVLNQELMLRFPVYSVLRSFVLIQNNGGVVKHSTVCSGNQKVIVHLQPESHTAFTALCGDVYYLIKTVSLITSLK